MHSVALTLTAQTKDRGFIACGCGQHERQSDAGCMGEQRGQHHLQTAQLGQGGLCLGFVGQADRHPGGPGGGRTGDPDNRDRPPNRPG
jgi:hypothetical protein